MKIIFAITTGDFQRIARDQNSSQLTNFPFALAAFVAIGAGLLAAATALVIWCAWIGAAGIILTFAGCALYGFSLCN